MHERSVIIDTCVWVRWLASKQPHVRAVDYLLEEELVLGHEIVYGELLIGDKGARAKPLSTYVLLNYAKTIAHQEVVELVRARHLYGVGIGWSDAHLLASALASRALLYTTDVDLHKAAVKLSIAYKP